MLKIPGILFLILIVSISDASAQGIASGPGYQMLLMNNPAFSGSEGSGVLRLSYLNLYPGNHYNLNSAYLSYDSYFEPLHGGAGVYISEDYLGGIVNDLNGGLSYAYFLQAGKNLYINGGLTISVFHRGYNFANAVFPDQIDPLGSVTFPSSEVPGITGKTLFDIGAGFLFISGKLSGGIAVNHLAEPELSSSTVSLEKIKRKYSLNLSYDLNLRSNGGLKLDPVLLAVQQGKYFSTGAGAAIESNHLAVNAIIISDNARNINSQAGFAFNFGLVSVYYNYQFNLKSGNNLMPFSLLHQVGMAIILYNVEKRNVIKTINFPKM